MAAYQIEVTKRPYGYEAVVTSEGHRAAVPAIRKTERGILRAAAALIRRLEAVTAEAKERNQ